MSGSIYILWKEALSMIDVAGVGPGNINLITIKGS